MTWVLIFLTQEMELLLGEVWQVSKRNSQYFRSYLRKTTGGPLGSPAGRGLKNPRSLHQLPVQRGLSFDRLTSTCSSQKNCTCSCWYLLLLKVFPLKGMVGQVLIPRRYDAMVGYLWDICIFNPNTLLTSWHQKTAWASAYFTIERNAKYFHHIVRNASHVLYQTYHTYHPANASQVHGQDHHVHTPSLVISLNRTYQNTHRSAVKGRVPPSWHIMVFTCFTTATPSQCFFVLHFPIFMPWGTNSQTCTFLPS